MVKKTNFLLFSLIAALIASPAYSVTVTKTYVDKQDAALQSNILLLRDMLNNKDSSGNWVTLDTEAQLAIPAINELKAALDAKANADDVLTSDSLTELNDAIDALESGKATVEDLATLQSAVDSLGEIYATDVELAAQIDAVKDLIPSVTDYVLASDLAAVATSGSYNDLIDKPTIPSIEGLATQESLNAVQESIPSLDGYAKTADVYTKGEIDNTVSSLVTDDELNTTLAGYATQSDLSTTKSELQEQIAGAVAGDMTEALKGYATTETVNAIDSRLTTAEGEIDALQATAVTTGNMATTLAGYAKDDELTTVSDKVTTAEGKIATLETTVAGLENYDDTEVRGFISTNTENIATNAENIAANTNAIENINKAGYIAQGDARAAGKYLMQVDESGAVSWLDVQIVDAPSEL